jgi:hypothetical protein
LHSHADDLATRLRRYNFRYASKLSHLDQEKPAPRIPYAGRETIDMSGIVPNYSPERLAQIAAQGVRESKPK